MARKLTIVVSCTERKSLPSPDHLRVRDLREFDRTCWGSEWVKRLHQPADQVRLDRLYQGEAWTQVSNLVRAAGVRGFAPTLLVVSAGLGLRRAESEGPGYAATFSRGHLDSVGVSNGENFEWWLGLRDAPRALDPITAITGQALIVLSEPYADVMAADLRNVSKTCDSALLVGGSDKISGIPRIPADIGLRRTLGGTASSISLRMATRWITEMRSSELFHAADARRWGRWSAGVRHVETYDRKALTDDEVRSFISQEIHSDPTTSATRSLRKLRDSGNACEQRRFGKLFREILGDT